METVIFMNEMHLLLSAALQGGFWTVALWIFCFVGAHVVKLAKYGWKYQNEQTKKTQPPPTAEQKSEEENKKAPAQTPQEPIYYIVERKQRKSKPRYGEPKEIHFK